MIFAKDGRIHTNINVLVPPGVLTFLVRKLSFSMKTGKKRLKIQITYANIVYSLPSAFMTSVSCVLK